MLARTVNIGNSPHLGLLLGSTGDAERLVHYGEPEEEATPWRRAARKSKETPHTYHAMFKKRSKKEKYFLFCVEHVAFINLL